MTGVHRVLASVPIAVTGVGVLTPLADDLPALSLALTSGRSSVEAQPDDSHPSAHLRDFDPRRYANVRGMRVYARNTQLQICAAQRALEDAGLAGGAIDPLQLGLVTASTFSHMETLLEYDRGLMTVGVQRTNPTLMPLGLPSAPGALTALSFGAKAFAITLSDGGASGVAALGHAARLLAASRARACLVTGAFTHCDELARSASRAELLAPAGGFRVFDRQSRGTAFGELAVALVLETCESARARGKEPLGFVRGQRSAFACSPRSLSAVLQRAASGALATAGCATRDISLVSAGASGILHDDAAEAHALRDLLGDTRASVTAPKASLGESLDASGLVQSALALATLRSGVGAPIHGLEEPVVDGLRYLRRATEVEPGCALVTSIAQSGACGALVLSVRPS